MLNRVLPNLSTQLSVQYAGFVMSSFDGKHGNVVANSRITGIYFWFQLPYQVSDDQIMKPLSIPTAFCSLSNSNRREKNPKFLLTCPILDASDSEEHKWTT